MLFSKISIVGGRCLIIFSSIYFSGWLIYRIILKKSLLPTPEQDRKNHVNPEVAKWRNSHSKVYNCIIGILVAASCAMGFICTSPFWRDLPYVVSNEWPQYEGVIVSDVDENTKGGEGDDVTIRDGEKELIITVIDINTSGPEYEKGDHIIVMYLPNSKIGFLLD